MLTIDLSAFEERARQLGAQIDQVPFALANAMSTAAFKTREYLATDTWVRSTAARNRSFIKRALRVQKATKRSLRAEIYDDLGRGHLKLHAVGGTKPARRNLAIPVSPGRGGTVRRTARGVAKADTPRAIRDRYPKRAVRVVKGKGIFVGKGGRLHLVYSLKASAHQPADVPFEIDFAVVFRREMQAAFPRALAAAMKTRGIKGRYNRQAALGRRASGSTHGNAGARAGR